MRARKVGYTSRAITGYTGGAVGVCGGPATVLRRRAQRGPTLHVGSSRAARPETPGPLGSFGTRRNRAPKSIAVGAPQ